MPWLSVTIFLPLIGVPILLFWRGIPDPVARGVALLASTTTFVVSLGLLGAFDASTPGYQLVERATWVRSIGLQYLVGVDGVSLFLVMLTTLIIPIGILASGSVTRNVRLFMACSLLLETAVLGAFLSLDLLLFFVFFEALLFPMYLLIGMWGSGRRVYAAVKFFLFTMFGSAFLLVAILFLFSRASGQFGRGTFELTKLQHLSLPPATERWLFLAFFIAFAVKVPLVPLHTWLPDAHTEAPTKGSIILAALLLKTGTYGLIRFNLVLFPEASHYFANAVSILALVGIIYGAIVAMMQSDLKRLIAYSSVSHLGFVVLGIFAFTQQGMSGGVLQMVNHGISTGALFLLVGLLYDRTHTRQLDELGGLADITPLLAGSFMVAALSSIGLPGLNNFVGEFLVILGTFTANRAFGVLAATGVVLGAIYLLWAYQRTWHGPPNERYRGLADLSRVEITAVAPLLVVMLVLGVYPKLLLDRINPTTNKIVQQVQVVRHDQRLLARGGG